MQGVMRLSTPHSASTSSSVPNCPTLPMVSGHRVISSKPASSSAATARRMVSSAFSSAASRLCLPQLPEWKMMRLPPSARHTAALCSRYWMLFSRLSSSRLDILI